MRHLRRPALPLLVLAVLSIEAAAADAPPAESPTPQSPESPPVNLVPAISGYAQALFTVGLDGTGDGVAPTASLFMRRARIKVKGQVFSTIGYTLMADFATPSNLLRDAFVTATFIRHHEIRIGQQKTQFGYENPEPAANLYVINRAYVSDALSRGADLRDLGIGVLGTWALPAGFGLDYQVTGVDGAGPNVLVDDTPRKNVWGRIGGSYAGPGWTLKAGLSSAVGDRLLKGDPATLTPDQTVFFARQGIDVRADTPWFFAAVEGVLGSNDPGTGATSASGFYALAAAKTPWSFGPLARVDFYDPDRSVSGDLLRRYTLGLYVDLRLPESKTAWARFLANLELDGSETRRDHALLSWVQVVF